MSQPVAPTPRKARKSMKSWGAPATDANQSVSSTTSTHSTPVSQRTQARKSTGTRRIAPATDAAPSRVEPRRTRNSLETSQNTTAPLSQPGGSRDQDSSDSDVEMKRKRYPLRISQNTTLPISQRSQPPDSSDSDFAPRSTRKILQNNSQNVSSTSGSAKKKPRRKGPLNESSSSPASTSEESGTEELLQKKAAAEERKEKSKKKTDDKLSAVPAISVNNLPNQCVFYILLANRSRKAIKKQDIIKNVFGGRNAQMFPEVLKKAGTILKKTFGFEIMEMKNRKNEYLLVNILSLEHDMREFAERSPLEHQQQGLIFYILTLIFMNENVIMEEELWKALAPLGIEAHSRKPHPIFGDVQKFVTNTLVKQMYLERKEVSKDPPQFELLWGERANKEVVKEDLLNFACQITDTNPEEWILQYNDAKARTMEQDAD